MKKETIAEFLARGGEIKKIPMKSYLRSDTVKPLPLSGEASFMSMEEADLFYGESKPKKTSNKKQSTIDIMMLPEELRQKYLKGMLNEQDEEESEEDDC